MAFKGINQYTVQESNNLKLGQLGFKQLTSAGNTGDGNFIAFYVTGESADDSVVVGATTHTGDDMDPCHFVAGSLVYGAFKKITISSPDNANVHVLCYYGA
tara:strand:+ start:80 stop:382 length:303 start_codon:yes stop_codon:yes gene_type:complete